MKVTGAEKGILLLAAVFLAFCGGWFLRGQSEAVPLRVVTERHLAQTEITLPAPLPPEETVLRVNVNTAGREELMLLPGIGEKRADDIVRDRAERGPFRFPEDLTRVPGIGDETVAGLRDFIVTEEAEP